MAVQQLSDLRDDVRDWSNRKDILDDRIDDFINIAQARLIRLLRIPPFEAEATILFINDNELPIPQDYLENRYISVSTSDGDIQLERKNFAFVDERAHVTGTPQYFSRKGGSFFVAPTPSDITGADIFYIAALQPLVVDTDSNWLVTDAPEALLYGALTELHLFTKDQNKAAAWEAKFQAVSVEIQNMADDAEWSGSSLAVLPRGATRGSISSQGG